jgi:hypothetical protein
MTNNICSITTLSTGTTTITSNSTSSMYYSMIDDMSKQIEFIEFAFKLIGIDLKYEDYIKLSDSDKKAILRDFKISKIID